jgi:hypothetical protein
MTQEESEFLSILKSHLETSLEKSELLGRIDERVKAIAERIPLLATCEKVDAVEAHVVVVEKKVKEVEIKVDKHIDTENTDRQWTVSQIITAIGAFGGLAVGFIALFRK